MTAPPETLVLIEPHAGFRRALRELIAAVAPETRIVGEAARGGQALELLDTTAPKAVVLTRTLPDRSGLTVLEQIRRVRPDVPVLMCSVDLDEASIRSALDRGARGVLLKQDAGDELLDALRAVCGGRRYLPEEWRDRISADG